MGGDTPAAACAATEALFHHSAGFWFSRIPFAGVHTMQYLCTLLGDHDVVSGAGCMGACCGAARVAQGSGRWSCTYNCLLSQPMAHCGQCTGHTVLCLLAG